MICCNSAFEQGNLDLWRYINAFIIINYTFENGCHVCVCEIYCVFLCILFQMHVYSDILDNNLTQHKGLSDWHQSRDISRVSTKVPINESEVKWFGRLN